jgi:hypothetical protein
LAQLADQSLTAERRSAHQGAKGSFGPLPELENVCRAVFTIARAVEPPRNRRHRSQRG